MGGIPGAHSLRELKRAFAAGMGNAMPAAGVFDDELILAFRRAPMLAHPCPTKGRGKLERTDAGRGAVPG